MIRNKINVLYSESFHKSMKLEKYNENKVQNQLNESSYENLTNLRGRDREDNEKTSNQPKNLMSGTTSSFYNGDKDNKLGSSSKNYSLSNEIDHLDNEIKSLQSKLKYMIDVKK